MRKFKRILALLLVFTLVLSVTISNKTNVNASAGGNMVTVYYNNSWSNAFIHYQVGNGDWTTVPGVQMETGDIEGYMWKYVIDLGTSDSATVCFNDGYGSWDSRNGTNYTIGTGCYGIKNGQVEKLLSATISADRAVGGTFNRTFFTVQASGGTAPYTYKYTFIDKSGVFRPYSTIELLNNIYGWEVSAPGIYDIAVDVKDANGVTVRAVLSDYVIEGGKFEYFNAGKASPQKVGTEIILSAKYINLIDDKYNSYSYYVSDGTRTIELSTNKDGTATWIPEKEGHYILTAKFHYFMGTVYETSMEYTISNEENVTIYYNNNNWSQAYIHFKTGNRNWTSVPGVRMETSDVAGYRWKYTISLKDADFATVCFNDGNGSWDSRNGLNYTYGKGTYYLNS